MLDKAVVRWADGSYDINRTCVMCQTSKCVMPVYTERYKIKGMEQWEVDLTTEASERVGLSHPTPDRVDAIDTIIAKENYAPEEEQNDD